MNEYDLQDSQIETARLNVTGNSGGIKENMPVIKSDRPEEMINNYNQGILDGALMTKPYYFEQFIDAYYYREYKNKSIYYLRGQVKELSDKRDLAILKMDTCKSQRVEKAAESQACSFELEYLMKEASNLDQRVVDSKESLSRIRLIDTDYSLFAGVIFFLFGVLFMAADYAICLNIVADTLKIGLNSNGSKGFIAHLFATALSGLAVVLKPAYDRIVERPYLQNKRKKVFVWVILIVSLSVITMLFALGVFREEVISLGITEVADFDINAPSQDAVMGDPGHSLAARVGIISSTVLFAIAAAVCLGISMPIIHKNFRIYWNKFRTQYREKSALQLHEKISIVQSRKAKLDIEVADLEEKISFLIKDIDVTESISNKEKLINMYLHGEKIQNAEKSKALYMAGYERGEKLADSLPREWIFEKMFMLTGESKQRTNNEMLGVLNKNSNSIGKRVRPFVALRKMITDSFKKKWNEENGKDIEYYNFD